MLKNWKKKIVAILLIFTMTFSNFALVGKTYAAYIADGIFGSSKDAGDTGSSNVEFDSYFKADESSEETKTISQDVKQSLIVGVDVKVKDSGYLKDAKVLFGDGEEVNFKFVNDNQNPAQTEENSEETIQDENQVEETSGMTEVEPENEEQVQETTESQENEVQTSESTTKENDNIQSFEDNELDLVQLNSGSDVRLEFPIKYNYKKFVEKDMISKTNKIKFEGTYVNNDAEEISVAKTVELKLSWEDDRQVTASSEITKYIGFDQNGASGLILQDSVKVDSSTDLTSLPIKNSQVEVTVPEIDGVKPETVNVVAKSLMGTSGKENDEVKFSNDNWSYDSNSNKIIINVENEAELVSTQNENDVLIDETAPMKEMYYSESGVDNYLITYTYKNVAIGERTISTNINANLYEFGKTVLNSNVDNSFDLKDEVGDIVTFTNETTTDSVSKGYTYLNYNNEESKYEIEIDNKLIFNVSYKDIVEGLYYVDDGANYVSKSGETFAQDDLYYKTLTLNKDNFINILGEGGVINVYNNGEVIYTINNETEADETGLIKIDFDNSVKNIQIETSKPINDGNLIFGTVRAYSSVSYDKNQYKDFDKITINTEGKAKYIYLNDLVDCGKSNVDVKLNDTETKATLEIGQSSLSTLAMNNNVEMKVELNNENINSDVYGNSRFQIQLPEYVESVEVTDYNIVYGEGLELGEVKGFTEDGRAYIDIGLNGEQKELSSGIISNGTNIVLHSNIKVNLFAPASSADFGLTYTNDEATNYDGGTLGAGQTTTSVNYSAPSGVVSVNSLSGFSEDQTKTITSVNQGKTEAEVPIYSDSKTIKSELTIMNNEQNNISGIAILGRVPFQGVKDITTGDDLGTTVNAIMTSKLVPEDQNETEFTYYYSENGEATTDLNDSSNGWTETPEDLASVKSFLIVPQDPAYTMEAASKLRFTYNYQIPANLEHNEQIYGTFATYFQNNTDIATLDDVSKADLVGLVTSEGPEFDFKTTVDKTKLNEYEELEITTTVTNKGKSTANNIVVTVPVPEYTKYVSSSSDNDNATVSSDEENSSNVEFKLGSLDSGATVNFKVTVQVEQFFSETNEDVNLSIYSLLSATDLDTILKTEEQTVTIEQAEMRVYIESTVMDPIMYKGNNAKLYVRVQNLTNDTLHNAEVSMKIPNEFNFVGATVLGYADNGVEVIDVKDANYDANSRTVTWNVGDISSLDIVSLKLQLEVGDIDQSVTKTTVTMRANTKADGTGEYTSGDVEFKIGRPLLVITQTTSTTNSYVKEGETINYQFNVKNEGSVTAQSVRLTDHIPEGLVVKSVSYVSEGVAVSKAVSQKDEVTIGVSIPAGDSLVVNVAAVATSLNGLGERSVTNNASVSATDVNSINSNDITHIIESSGNVVSGQGESSTGKASSSSNESVSLSKTYKITGTAWHDKNNNGMRDDGEDLMKGVTATLVDSDGGIIKQSTSTNSKGEYTFTGVRNGNYIIIFDYDTVRYTVTAYQKENVAQNVNSDAITTKVEQDGKLRNGAVTGVVTVTDGSVSNIDIGLVDALKFDLSLDMGISKITTNTSKGTTTKEYNNSKLTKTEIRAKQVEGSSVYIEYTLTVKNEGEVAGIAKKVVDYIPGGMKFDSGMNQNWFTGSDGNLYTQELASTELQPGETKTFKLVLSKTLTGEDFGTVSNTAEIAEDYNIYGISDLDSTPGNKAQNEDDFARADSYLSVSTGGVFIYISVIITAVILGGLAVTLITLKVRSKKEAKGGV